jgi:hypothetical protein
VICTHIYFIHCLKTAEDNGRVNLDKFGEGIDKHFDTGNENAVFEFVCTYVQMIRPNAKWKKCMRRKDSG